MTDLNLSGQFGIGQGLLPNTNQLTLLAQQRQQAVSQQILQVQHGIYPTLGSSIAKPIKQKAKHMSVIEELQSEVDSWLSDVKL